VTPAFVRLRVALAAAALWLAPLGAAPAPTPVPAAGFCPVAVNVHPLDARRAGLTFTTPSTPGPVAGTIALFGRGVRYEVPFHAFSLRDDQRFTPQTIIDPATVMVVRFPSPVAVDAAVVRTLDGRACRPAYQPWLASVERTPTPPAIEEAFRRAPVVDVPRASNAPPAPACANANAAPKLLKPVELDVPSSEVPIGAGRAILLVTIDQNGAVVRSRVLQSSGSDAADAIAVRDTAAAKFAPGLFACEPDVSTYTFAFTFS